MRSTGQRVAQVFNLCLHPLKTGATLRLVFIVALIARTGLGIARLAATGTGGDALTLPDEQQYWTIATSLANGEGMADELGFVATRMPLYPAMLSLFTGMEHGIVVAKALHWIIGALGAVLAAGLARSVARQGRSGFARHTSPPPVFRAKPALPLCAHRQDAGATLGLIAGLLVAMDPYLIYFSSLLLTETLFITVLLAFWWALVAWLPWDRHLGRGVAHLGQGVAHRFSGGGHEWTEDSPPPRLKPWATRRVKPALHQCLVTAVLAAVCVYIRPSSLFFIVAGLGWVVGARRFNRSDLAGVVLVLVLLIGSLTPWAARNARLTGHWCWLTHRAGISLYDGVGPQATGASDLGNIKNMEAVRSFVESGDEAGWNQYFLDRSYEAFAADPIRTVKLAFIKLGRTWNVFPNLEAGQHWAIRLVSATWTVPMYVLGIIGVGVLTVGLGGPPPLEVGDTMMDGRVTPGYVDRTQGSRTIIESPTSEDMGHPPPTSEDMGHPPRGASAQAKACGSGGAVAAVLLVLPAVVVSVLHAFFVGSVRYRLPAMPMIEILAAIALVTLWDNRRARRESNSE